MYKRQGQDVAVTETATSFVNERQKVEVSLEKALETNERFGIGNNGEIKNISFGLFAEEELVSASGTSIPKDGLLEIITLDENGRATVGTDLPLGSYYVKELAKLMISSMRRLDLYLKKCLSVQECTSALMRDVQHSKNL